MLDDTELNELAIPSDIQDSESIDMLALFGLRANSGLELGFSTPENILKNDVLIYVTIVTKLLVWINSNCLCL